MGSALAASLVLLLAAGTRNHDPHGDRLEKAQAEFNRGNFDGALKDLDAAQSEAADLPTLARIHLLRAQSFAAKQDYVQAEAALAEALEFDPDASLDPAKIDPALVKILDSLRARLTGELRVSSDPPVKVKLDGVDRGTTPLRVEVSIGRHTLEGESEDGKWAGKQQVLVRRSGTPVNLILVKVSAVGSAPVVASGIPAARADRPLIPFGELRFDMDFSHWFAQQFGQNLIEAIGSNFDNSFGEMVGGGVRSRFFRASADIRFRPVPGLHLRGALGIPLTERIDGYVSVEVLGDFIAATLEMSVGAALGAEYLKGDWFGLFSEVGARHWFFNGEDDVVLQVGVRVWFP